MCAILYVVNLSVALLLDPISDKTRNSKLANENVLHTYVYTWCRSRDSLGSERSCARDDGFSFFVFDSLT